MSEEDYSGLTGDPRRPPKKQKIPEIKTKTPGTTLIKTKIPEIKTKSPEEKTPQKTWPAVEVVKIPKEYLSPPQQIPQVKKPSLLRRVAGGFTGGIGSLAGGIGSLVSKKKFEEEIPETPSVDFCLERAKAYSNNPKEQTAFFEGCEAGKLECESIKEKKAKYSL